MVVAVIMVEFSLFRQAVLKPTTKEHFERDKKFSAFKKNDSFLHEQVVGRLILYMMTPFVPFRFCLGWGASVTMSTIVKIFTVVCSNDPATYTPI